MFTKLPFIRKTMKDSDRYQNNRLDFGFEITKEIICIGSLLFFTYQSGMNFDYRKIIGFLFLATSAFFNAYLSFKKKIVKFQSLEKVKNIKECESIIPWYYMLIFNITVVLLILPNFSKLFSLLILYIYILIISLHIPV